MSTHTPRRAESSDVIAGVGKALDALRRLVAMDIAMPEGEDRDSVIRDLQRVSVLSEELVENVCAPEPGEGR